MITINILSDSKYPLDRVGMREGLEKILKKNQLTENVEMTVLVVGKRKMTQLHVEHMDLPGPTDVLSFPMIDQDDSSPFVASPDGILHLGDVVVCYPVAVEQALTKQIKLDQELQFLSEHGLMHLLGHHHE